MTLLHGPRIVIIGGGILGAAACYALARQGARVTLLERDSLCSGASAGNLGKLSIMERDEPWELATALASNEAYRELQANVDIEYDRCGGIMVLRGEEMLRAGAAMCRHLATKDVAAALLTGRDVQVHEPGLDLARVDAIAYCAAEAKLNPLLTTLAYLDMAREAGARLLPRTRATGFRLRGSRVAAVVTEAGSIEADVVVNAAGGWAGEIARMAGVTVLVGHHRGTALVTEPWKKIIRTCILDGRFLLPPGRENIRHEITLGAVQTRRGSILASRIKEEAPLGDTDVTAQGLCLLAANLVAYFPELRGIQAVRAWSSVTPLSVDGRPSFGFHREVPNLFALAGFKGAFGIAPVAGENAARMILRGVGWEGNAFAPDRD